MKCDVFFVVCLVVGWLALVDSVDITPMMMQLSSTVFGPNQNKLYDCEAALNVPAGKNYAMPRPTLPKDIAKQALTLHTIAVFLGDLFPNKGLQGYSTTQALFTYGFLLKHVQGLQISALQSQPIKDKLAQMEKQFVRAARLGSSAIRSHTMCAAVLMAKRLAVLVRALRFDPYMSRMARLQQTDLEQTVIFELGYVNTHGGHAIYGEIIRDGEDTFMLLVHNSGEGIEHHEKHMSGPKVLSQPALVFAGIPAAVLLDDLFLATLFVPQTLVGTKVSGYYTAEFIYNSVLYPLHPYKVFVPEMPFAAPQTSGSCAFSGLHVILRLKLLGMLPAPSYPERLFDLVHAASGQILLHGFMRLAEETPMSSLITTECLQPILLVEEWIEPGRLIQVLEDVTRYLIWLRRKVDGLEEEYFQGMLGRSIPDAFAAMLEHVAALNANGAPASTMGIIEWQDLDANYGLFDSNVYADFMEKYHQSMSKLYERSAWSSNNLGMISRTPSMIPLLAWSPPAKPSIPPNQPSCLQLQDVLKMKQDSVTMMHIFDSIALLDRCFIQPAERIAALNHLILRLAPVHDLKQPLSPLAGYTSVLDTYMGLLLALGPVPHFSRKFSLLKLIFLFYQRTVLEESFMLPQPASLMSSIPFKSEHFSLLLKDSNAVPSFQAVYHDQMKAMQAMLDSLTHSDYPTPLEPSYYFRSMSMQTWLSQYAAYFSSFKDCMPAYPSLNAVQPGPGSAELLKTLAHAGYYKLTATLTDVPHMYPMDMFKLLMLQFSEKPMPLERDVLDMVAQPREPKKRGPKLQPATSPPPVPAPLTGCWVPPYFYQLRKYLTQYEYYAYARDRGQWNQRMSSLSTNAVALILSSQSVSLMREAFTDEFGPVKDLKGAIMQSHQAKELQRLGKLNAATEKLLLFALIPRKVAGVSETNPVHFTENEALASFRGKANARARLLAEVLMEGGRLGPLVALHHALEHPSAVSDPFMRILYHRNVLLGPSGILNFLDIGHAGRHHALRQALYTEWLRYLAIFSKRLAQLRQWNEFIFVSHLMLTTLAEQKGLIGSALADTVKMAKLFVLNAGVRDRQARTATMITTLITAYYAFPVEAGISSSEVVVPLASSASSSSSTTSALTPSPSPGALRLELMIYALVFLAQYKRRVVDDKVLLAELTALDATIAEKIEHVPVRLASIHDALHKVLPLACKIFMEHELRTSAAQITCERQDLFKCRCVQADVKDPGPEPGANHPPPVAPVPYIVDILTGHHGREAQQAPATVLPPFTMPNAVLDLLRTKPYVVLDAWRGQSSTSAASESQYYHVAVGEHSARVEYKIEYVSAATDQLPIWRLYGVDWYLLKYGPNGFGLSGTADTGSFGPDWLWEDPFWADPVKRVFNTANGKPCIGLGTGPGQLRWVHQYSVAQTKKVFVDVLVTELTKHSDTPLLLFNRFFQASILDSARLFGFSMLQWLIPNLAQMQWHLSPHAALIEARGQELLALELPTLLDELSIFAPHHSILQFISVTRTAMLVHVPAYGLVLHRRVQMGRPGVDSLYAAIAGATLPSSSPSSSSSSSSSSASSSSSSSAAPVLEYTSFHPNYMEYAEGDQILIQGNRLSRLVPFSEYEALCRDRLSATPARCSLCRLRNHLLPHLLVQSFDDPSQYELLYPVRKGTQDDIRRIKLSWRTTEPLLDMSAVSGEAKQNTAILSMATMLMRYDLFEEAFQALQQLHPTEPFADTHELSLIRAFLVYRSSSPYVAYLQVYLMYLLMQQAALLFEQDGPLTDLMEGVGVHSILATFFGTAHLVHHAFLNWEAGGGLVLLRGLPRDGPAVTFGVISAGQIMALLSWLQPRLRNVDVGTKELRLQSVIVSLQDLSREKAGVAVPQIHLRSIAMDVTLTLEQKIVLPFLVHPFGVRWNSALLQDYARELLLLLRDADEPMVRVITSASMSRRIDYAADYEYEVALLRAAPPQHSMTPLRDQICTRPPLPPVRPPDQVTKLLKQFTVTAFQALFAYPALPGPPSHSTDDEDLHLTPIVGSIQAIFLPPEDLSVDEDSVAVGLAWAIWAKDQFEQLITTNLAWLEQQLLIKPTIQPLCLLHGLHHRSALYAKPLEHVLAKAGYAAAVQLSMDPVLEACVTNIEEATFEVKKLAVLRIFSDQLDRYIRYIQAQTAQATDPHGHMSFIEYAQVNGMEFNPLDFTFDVRAFPWLVTFERFSSKSIRPDQVASLLKLLGQFELQRDPNDAYPSSLALQMVMGAGKTSVLTPNLLFGMGRYHPHMSSLLIYPKSLLHQGILDIRHRTRDAFGLTALPLQCERSKAQLAPWKLGAVLVTLAESNARRQYFVTSPENMLCLRNLLAETITYHAVSEAPSSSSSSSSGIWWKGASADSLASYSLLAQVMAYFRRRSLMAADEAHAVFEPTHELNSPGQARIAEDPLLNFLFGRIVHQLYSSPDHIKELDNLASIIMGSIGDAEAASDDALAAERQAATLCVLRAAMSVLCFSDATPPMCDNLLVTSGMSRDVFVEELMRMGAYMDTSHPDALNRRRAVFKTAVMTHLAVAHSKVATVHYGLSHEATAVGSNDPDGSPAPPLNLAEQAVFAVPYTFADTPTKGSTFSDPFLTSILTFMLYEQYAIPGPVLAAMLREDRLAVARWCDLYLTSQNGVADTTQVKRLKACGNRDLFELSLDPNGSDIASLAKDLRTRCVELRLMLLQDHAFRALDVRATQVSSIPMQLGLVSRQYVTFSGTIENAENFWYSGPSGVDQSEGAKQRDRIHARLRELRPAVLDLEVLLGTGTAEAISLEANFDTFATRIRLCKYTGIIDVGAVFSTVKPDRLARNILHACPNKRYVVYHQEGQLVVLYRDSALPVPFDAATMRLDHAEAFALYGHAYCFGADLPLPFDAYMMLSFSDHVTLSALEQAILRMRQYLMLGAGGLTGQRFDYLIDGRAKRLAQKYLSRLAGEAVASLPIIIGFELPYILAKENMLKALRQERVLTDLQRPRIAAFECILQAAYEGAMDLGALQQLSMLVPNSFIFRRVDSSPDWRPDIVSLVQHVGALQPGSMLHACLATVTPASLTLRDMDAVTVARLSMQQTQVKDASLERQEDLTEDQADGKGEVGEGVESVEAAQATRNLLLRLTQTQQQDQQATVEIRRDAPDMFNDAMLGRSLRVEQGGLMLSRLKPFNSLIRDPKLKGLIWSFVLVTENYARVYEGDPPAIDTDLQKASRRVLYCSMDSLYKSGSTVSAMIMLSARDMLSAEDRLPTNCVLLDPLIVLASLGQRHGHRATRLTQPSSPSSEATNVSPQPAQSDNQVLQEAMTETATKGGAESDPKMDEKEEADPKSEAPPAPSSSPRQIRPITEASSLSEQLLLMQCLLVTGNVHSLVHVMWLVQEWALRNALGMDEGDSARGAAIIKSSFHLVEHFALLLPDGQAKWNNVADAYARAKYIAQAAYDKEVAEKKAGHKRKLDGSQSSSSTDPNKRIKS